MPLIDTLTNLYNRRGFMRTCRHLFGNLDGYASSAMLLSVKLEHLEFVEHALGLGIAEEMLKRTAQILLDVFQDHAIIGRWSADQFVIVSVVARHRCNALVRSLNEHIDAANSTESRIRLSLSGQFKLFDLAIAARKVRIDRPDTVLH
jgi:two-component system, cell cycle response regulator